MKCIGIDCEDINWIRYKMGALINSIKRFGFCLSESSLYSFEHNISLITRVEDLMLELRGSIVG
jgi:hypothetical protein